MTGNIHTARIGAVLDKPKEPLLAGKAQRVPTFNDKSAPNLHASHFS